MVRLPFLSFNFFFLSISLLGTVGIEDTVRPGTEVPGTRCFYMIVCEVITHSIKVSCHLNWHRA